MHSLVWRLIDVLRELHKFTWVFVRLPLWFPWKPASVSLCCFSITDEAGASIYSVSPEAVKEMPDMDPNLRSAGNLHIPSFHALKTSVWPFFDIMQIYGMEFKDVEWDIHTIWNQRNTCLYIVFAQNYQQTLKTENVNQPLTRLLADFVIEARI